MVDSLGVDFNKDYKFNEDGDIQLVSEEKNIMQRVYNRLNTDLYSLDYFYNEYGANLQLFSGVRITERLLDFIKIEVETSLKQDPLLEDAEVTITPIKEGIRIDLYKEIDEDTTLDIGLIMTEDEGVDIIGSG